MSYHLAQVNIAIAKYSYDDVQFTGFVDNLDRIYALAESTPGFVWRHVSVDGDAEAMSVFADQSIIFNMSVWETYEALRQYVFESEHLDILRQRAKWFKRQCYPTIALWWLKAGTIPRISEAKHRLDLLAQSGPTPDAFTFRDTFAAPVTQEMANA